MQQRQLNNYHLDSVSGRWTKGTVKRRLMEKGWGADLGFPRMVLDDSANCIDVFVLEASNLPVMSAKPARARTLALLAERLICDTFWQTTY